MVYLLSLVLRVLVQLLLPNLFTIFHLIYLLVDNISICVTDTVDDCSVDISEVGASGP